MMLYSLFVQLSWNCVLHVPCSLLWCLRVTCWGPVETLVRLRFEPVAFWSWEKWLNPLSHSPPLVNRAEIKHGHLRFSTSEIHWKAKWAMCHGKRNNRDEKAMSERIAWDQKIKLNASYFIVNGHRGVLGLVTRICPTQEHLNMFLNFRIYLLNILGLLKKYF